MSFRNQNKPPTPCGPVNKNRAVDEAPLDKRKKIGTGRTMSSTTASRGRQALAPMITQKDAPVAPSETELTECENLEFTTDEIDVLLNEKFKGKKFDSKGKQDWLTEYIKKLKLCIKWFQKGLEDIVEEKENLHTMLDSSERKCVEAEAATKIKEEELNSTISELENNISSLKDSLANEESQKLDALDCLKIEREARLALEKDKISLKEELARAEQNVITANEKVKTQEDTYKRLKELNSNLHSHNIRLQKELEAKQKVETEKLTILENLTTLRGHKNFLEKELTFAKDSRDESVKQKETAMKEVDILRGELQQFREDRERQLSQIQELSSEVIRYKENTARTASEVNSLGMKTIEMEETCSTQREQISLLQHQLKVANQKLKMADLSSSEVRTEYEELKRRVKELEDELHEAEAQLLKGEELRKKLHNTILELKGNIRVFCRVRPMLSDDSPAADPIISYPTSVESAGRGIDIVPYGPKGSFTFDKVFSYDASQEDVFMEISQLVQSALDGYKVCIFAYGQTGSGKTYTMMGKQDNPKDMGLIPRSLEQIFKSSQAKAAQGWNYKMQASMLEIYNDTIRDLLGARLSTGGSLAIRQDADGNTYVPELTIINVTNINEVSDLLQQAARSRTIGRTDMNEESSRSHFVFTLKIIGVKESSSEQVEGVLNLIDLAGSERIAKSGVTGDRMTETRAINKSLTALGNVFTALASHKNKKEKGHVPFRDSKLTYLLQPCLGGDSKTLMFVNISPDPLSVNESYNSLEFAKKVNGCEIGIPSRQTIRQINTQLGRG